MELASPTSLTAAMRHLSSSDPLLAALVQTHGMPQFAPHTDYYGSLVSSIVGQQLSVKAAAAIRARFLAMFSGTMPSPEQILGHEPEDFRAIGFSSAKGRYIHDLALHIADGRLQFDAIPKQSNQEIIAMLTQVKGIGEWTAHMFLMFCVGRLNVLPVGDLGIRNGIRDLYDLDTAPSPDEVAEVALKNNWSPYESVASWYIWRSLDNEPA